MLTSRLSSTSLHSLKSRATRISSSHRESAKGFSTHLDPSSSQSSLASTLQSIQLPSNPLKKGSRLRDRAGLPAFRDSTLDRLTGNSQGSGEKVQVKQNGLLRTRTQLERAEMNHKERSIALELLEDLGIPLEELQQNTPSSTEPNESSQSSQSPINDLFQRPEFQSVLLQKQASSNKNLLRHRPAQLSPDEIRLEDLLKELADSQIRKIDSFETDFQLLAWVDEVVFSDSKRSPSTNSPVEKKSKLQIDEHSQGIDSESKLGQVFEKSNHVHRQYNPDLEVELDYIQDLEASLNQPLCFTPLFSPILLHLLKLTSNQLKNPFLALYLFNWVRSHPNPVVKYFGMTKDTYFENLRIKWEFFKDFRGIKDDLLEMRAMGLELDERFKNFIQSITKVVWEDELGSENISNQASRSRVNIPSISLAERRYASQIESILHDFIETQNHAFARKLRALPSDSN